jgi:palmitoyltransferase ZDHHC9/14/18
MTQSTGITQSVDDEDSPRRTRTPGQSRAQTNTRPLSRGTDITDYPDLRGISEVVPDLPEGAADVVKQGSFRDRLDDVPLQNNYTGEKQTNRPAGLDMSRLQGAVIPRPQRSPRSLASRISNRASKSSFQMRQTGHEKLPSDVSMPNIQYATKEAVKKELGKNYEFFQGNTVFWMGGRFQNTRDRPINIATGLLLLLPLGLFAGFSLVLLYVTFFD